jgi:hypothetical protein
MTLASGRSRAKSLALQKELLYPPLHPLLLLYPPLHPLYSSTHRSIRSYSSTEGSCSEANQVDVSQCPKD